MDDWLDDPASDERWNAGCTYALEQLCRMLGVDSKDINWDAATETLDGDVQAVMGNILRAKYGEDWGPMTPRAEQNQREMAAGTRCDGSCKDGLPCHC